MQAHPAIAPLVAPLLSLPADQRLELIEQLWGSLAPTDLDRPVPEWKANVLESSKTQYLAEPKSAKSWEELRLEPATAIAKS